MVKKQNHKIFNLIVMIFTCIIMFNVLNVSYASEKSFLDNSEMYLADSEETIFSATEADDTGRVTDYIPDEFEDGNHKENKTDTSMWSYINNNELFKELRKNVALWYTIFRYFAIAGMLVTFIILGIKLALASLAEERAIYKTALVNWVACFILLFFIHYFMIFVLYLNETLIGWFREFSLHLSEGQEYGLYQTARSRAYDMRFTVGFTGMAMYMTLVYLTVKYIFMYLKRTIVIVILTILSPIVILIYSLQKILFGKGKPQILMKWMEEYATNVLLQSIHALVYAVFVGLALRLSNQSVIGFILSFVFLNFLTKADTIFKKLFKFTDGSKMSEDIDKTSVSDYTRTAASVAAAASVAKQTGVGQAIGGLYSKIGRAHMKPLIRAASAIENTEIAQSLAERIQNRRDEKDQERQKLFEDKLNTIDTKMNEIKNLAENNTDVEKQKEYARRYAELARAREKVENQRGNYNFRRAMYERIRYAFDPDAYMEYVTDENGNKIPSRFGNGYRRRVIRAKKVYDEETEKDLIIGGLKNRLSTNINEILGLNQSDKAILKEIRQDISSGVIGFGGMILGMGMVADNPSIGFALLASSGTKLAHLNKFKNNSSLKISRKFKSKLADANLKLKDAQFSTGALISIEEEIKKLTSSDPTIGRLNDLLLRLQSRKLKYMVPVAPFVLTGTLGMLENAVEMARRMQVQHIKDLRQFQIEGNLEVLKALRREIVEVQRKLIEHEATYTMERSTVRLMFEQRIQDGTIFFNDSAGIGFAFNTEKNQDVTSRDSRFRQAIIDTALQNHIYSFDRFDFDNEYTRRALVNNLKKQGVLDSTQGGINTIISNNMDVFDRIKAEEPDLLKVKLFESIVVDYANSMKDDYKGVSSLRTEAAYSAITTKYLDSLSSKHQDLDMKNIILHTAFNSGAPYDALDASDIAKLMKRDHPEEYAKFLQDMRSSGINDPFEEIVKKKKSQLDRTMDTMILGAMVNENVTRISDVSLFSDSPTPAMVAFKANLMSYFDFAGFDISNEALSDVLEDRIKHLTDEDIQKAIIRQEISKFIDEKCGGRSEDLNDPDKKDELNEIIESRLLDYYKEDDEIYNIDEVTEHLNRQRQQEQGASDDSDTDSTRGDFIDEEVTENEEESMLDINIPTPTVTTSISDDGTVCCEFGLRKGYEDYIIESCIKTIDSSSKFVPNMTIQLLSSSEERACARLSKDGKYGPILAIKYPESAISIVEKIRDSGDVDNLQRKEDKKRNRAEKSKLEEVANTVFSNIYDISAETDIQNFNENVLGEQALENAADENTEFEFRKMTIQKEKNNVDDVVANLLQSKANNEILVRKVSNSLEQNENVRGKRFYFDDESREQEYSNLEKQLLEKVAEAVLIKEDSKRLKDKEFSKAKKLADKLYKGIKTDVSACNVNDVISQINGRRGT